MHPEQAGQGRQERGVRTGDGAAEEEATYDLRLVLILPIDLRKCFLLALLR